MPTPTPMPTPMPTPTSMPTPTLTSMPTPTLTSHVHAYSHVPQIHNFKAVQRHVTARFSRLARVRHTAFAGLTMAEQCVHTRPNHGLTSALS